MPAVIEHITRAELITLAGPARPVPARLLYDPGDPLAVQVGFPAEVSLDDAGVTWVFARELLNAGLGSPAGEGDVHLWPYGPDRMRMEFRAPEGAAVVELRTSDVRHFLSRSYAALPADQERHGLRLDQGLAALLGNV